LKYIISHSLSKYGKILFVAPKFIGIDNLCNFFFLDKCISCLLEVALSGNEEQKPFDYKLRPEIAVFVDLALGCSKEPARSLWISMQDYAISKGKVKRIKGINM